MKLSWQPVCCGCVALNTWTSRVPHSTGGSKRTETIRPTRTARTMQLRSWLQKRCVLRKFHTSPCSSSDAHEVAKLRKRVKELEAEKAASRIAPTGKRHRRGGNNVPVEHVTSSPLLKNDSRVKPLRENYPATVTAQSVNACIRKLPKKKEASIKTAIKDAEQVFKQLSEPQLASLPDVAAEWVAV